jgi:hypothetical protein
MVWRNASTSHFFAPWPGHASVPGFIEFYSDPYTAFELDLPPMYARPGSDLIPPAFTVQPDSYYVSTDTLVTLYFETEERAHLGYGSADQPYAAMPDRFSNGQGGFKHSTTIACSQGTERILYIRAIDISGNETPEALRITIKVDTLQRIIPWHDDRYPSSSWKSGKAPLGYGAAAGNATTIENAKTAYFLSAFILPQPVEKLGLLLKCHDGAVVRLNGIELLRYNLPSGGIAHDTPAWSSAKTNLIYMLSPQDVQLLRTGENQLAVEVHAADLANADLSFDARVFDASQIYFNLGSSWRYFDGGVPPPFTLADFLNGVHPQAALQVRELALAQNYPNPFNPETAISFNLTKPGEVRLEVYDITGRRVATLFNSRQPAGEHKVTFRGDGLASGVYLYRLIAEGTTQVRRMLLLR